MKPSPDELKPLPPPPAATAPPSTLARPAVLLGALVLPPPARLAPPMPKPLRPSAHSDMPPAPLPLPAGSDEAEAEPGLPLLGLELPLAGVLLPLLLLPLQQAEEASATAGCCCWQNTAGAPKV